MERAVSYPGSMISLNRIRKIWKQWYHFVPECQRELSRYCVHEEFHDDSKQGRGLRKLEQIGVESKQFRQQPDPQRVAETLDPLSER
jgi:uncharacterized protein (DUF488 family)